MLKNVAISMGKYAQEIIASEIANYLSLIGRKESAKKPPGSRKRGQEGGLTQPGRCSEGEPEQ
jgi:hypothetical protein